MQFINDTTASIIHIRTYVIHLHIYNNIFQIQFNINYRFQIEGGNENVEQHALIVVRFLNRAPKRISHSIPIILHMQNVLVILQFYSRVEKCFDVISRFINKSQR